MASSTRYTLLADDQRHSLESATTTRSYEDETVLLGGLATTSPSRPFYTKFHPTLLTRAIALILLLPAFVLFVIRGKFYAGSIVFISFAIARQLVVLGAHFGSKLIRIHIEIVHDGFQGVSAAAQEQKVKRIFGLVVDGIILVGMLVTLSLNAHRIDTYTSPRGIVQAVILGFVAFGLLLESAFDFGNPSEITLELSVTKVGRGQLHFSSGLLYGQSDDADDDDDDDDAEDEAHGNNQRGNASRAHDIV